MDRLSFKGEAIEQIDLRAVPHSGFDRSNHNYGTGKLGSIIPTRLDETYPGDRIKGAPIMVTNFEPLAAPLMGSMVQKQEAFFIPLIQVWKNAYKFFTGKNGYDGKVPSVTPLDIYDVYYTAFLHRFTASIGDNDNDELDDIIKAFNEYYDSLTPGAIYSQFSVNSQTFYKDLQNWAHEFDQQLKVVYDTRKMYDLVLPIVKHVNQFVESSYIAEFSLKLEDEENKIDSKELLAISGHLGDLLKDIHQFFFGPSSLLDYIGWPITTSKSLKAEYDIVDYGVTNIFSYFIYRNILIYGSYIDMGDAIRSKFSEVPLNFLPFRGYYLTWYWNYRDQLLETDILDPEDDGFLSDTVTDNEILYCTLLRQRCWFKDAFTTALTNTGSGNLLVPTLAGIDQTASIAYYSNDGLINTSDAAEAYAAGATVAEVSMDDYVYKVPMNYLSSSLSEGDREGAGTDFISLDLFDRIKRLRSFIQKKLVLGYEVDDVIWSSFMVRISNVRLHIPELLGRGRDAVEISTLVNNTSTDQQIAGDKTATAWCKGSISDVNYFCEEWGFYLQLGTVMPIQTYAGGMQRLYLKRDVFDYMWPEFATMGMDAVYNCELAALGTRLSDEKGLQVFGYQGRYYDLKYRQDEEHGRLLEDLNYLTFSREFDEDNLPKQNYIFVHCWPRLDGFVIESPLIDVFRYDCYTAQGWERRLPVPSEYVA